MTLRCQVILCLVTLILTSSSFVVLDFSFVRQLFVSKINKFFQDLVPFLVVLRLHTRSFIQQIMTLSYCRDIHLNFLFRTLKLRINFSPVKTRPGLSLNVVFIKKTFSRQSGTTCLYLTTQSLYDSNMRSGSTFSLVSCD